MSAPEPDHARLKELFAEVCDLPRRAEALARLAELHATPEECAQVLQLLAHDDGHTTHLSAPVKHMAASAAGGELNPGDRLGAWTLVRELGAGGMGRVFEAQRSDGHYEQRSAIKVLRGFSGEAALAQLAHERQLLATLNHPNIARLLDGGTTPAGNPYLVMEHVDGLRIDEHVRLRGLGLDAVLDLFLMVCDAVAYAHRRRIVHCDIKPSNVLVDDEGRAKLLDFGIAQLAGSGMPELKALTPRWASPEQLAGQAPTTASDVYSLGRLLDELLRVLRTHGQREPGVPDERLQAVVAAATADLPEVRYADVRALSGELHRFLDHRERDAAIAARHQAQQEAEAKGQVTEFVLSLFRAADPNASGHPELKVSEILARGRVRIDDELKGRAALQAELKFVLAGVYDNMGQPGQSQQLYQEALRLERALVPQRPSRMVRLLVLQAQALADDGHREAALQPAREAYELVQARPDAPAREVADALSHLGWIEAGVNRFDDGRRHLQEALRLWEGELGLLHRWPAVTRHNLGQLEIRAGNFVQAERELHQALQVMRSLPDLPVPVMLTTFEAWAVSLVPLQRAHEALPELLDAVAQRRQLNGSGSIKLARSLHQLSTVLHGAGQPAKALAAADEAIAIVRAGHPKSLNLARFLLSRALALQELGDPATADAYADALAERDAQPLMDAWIGNAIAFAYGSWLSGVGRLAEAEVQLLHVAQERRRTLSTDHIERLEAELELATVQQRLASQAGAKPPGLQALAQSLAAVEQAGLGSMPPRVGIALARARAMLAGDAPQALPEARLRQPG